MRRSTPLLLVVAWLVLWSTGVAGQVVPRLLTTTAAVRMLSPQEADEGRPVRLQGNLLLITALGNALVLLDGDEGVYVEFEHPVPADYRPGDRLEIAGVSNAGDFAPIVRASQVVRLGPGKLPVPRQTTIAELNAGGFDAAWIELRGIVRSCVPTPPDRRSISRPGSTGSEGPVAGVAGRESWQVTFAQGEDKMQVQINGHVSPPDIVDADVRIRGVVFNVHNANRQFVRAHLQVADDSMIEVLVPPPADPFALPVQPVGEVMRFSRTGFSGHRLQVRGVVTGHKGGHTLWLRDGDRGMRAASVQQGNLAPGDEVEVVGFPDHGGYTPSLSDGIFRKVAAGPVPMPRVLQTPEEISRHDSDLVQIDAVLKDLRPSPDGLELVLDWKGQEVYGRILQAAAAAETAGWEAESQVRVTGICLVGQTNFLRPTGLWVAQDLQLLLRTPRDLAVLQPAPWLTTPRALRLVIIIAGATLLALIAVAVMARRQLAQREVARRLAEVEFSAMLAERNRLARDIHDTLAQDLNAVSVQLELAKNSAKSGRSEPIMPHLGAAHQIVRQCLTEARESIWNMRSHILEKHDLAGALRSVAEQLSAGLECDIRTRVVGKPRRLAPTLENNLLRIGQEAVSNALKHARPRVIGLELSFAGSSVGLVVTDDGPGFDPTLVSAASSHFGLRGMRERAAQINGKLQIGRGADGGTRLEVVVESPDSA